MLMSLYTQSLSTAYDPQEDDEAELSLFKIERKQNNGDMAPWNNTEVLLVPSVLLDD
jgi:hypothetical protein